MRSQHWNGIKPHRPLLVYCHQARGEAETEWEGGVPEGEAPEAGGGGS